MRVRHKPWAKDFLASLPFHVSVDDFSIDTLKLNKQQKIAIEIGVGKGEFLKLMAVKFPDVFFIGVELNASVLSVAAEKFINVEFDNFILINGNALARLPKLPANIFDYIILNHSDPWPKKRHEKRRLTSKAFMDEYVRVLKADGDLLFKSDNDDFSHYSHAVFMTYPFKSVGYDENYDGSAPFDAETEYERKFRLKGVKIKRIIAKK